MVNGVVCFGFSEPLSLALDKRDTFVVNLNLSTPGSFGQPPLITRHFYFIMALYRSSEGGYDPIWGPPTSTLKYTFPTS